MKFKSSIQNVQKKHQECSGPKFKTLNLKNRGGWIIETKIPYQSRILMI